MPESAHVTLVVHTADATQRLHIKAGTTVRDALDTTALRVRAACGGTGSCGACLIKYLAGAVNPATVAEYQKLTPAERQDGIRLACQMRLLGDAEVLLEHPAHACVWKSIAPEDLGTLSGQRSHLQQAIYGLAVDLGTTHIRLALWDCKHGCRIATRSGVNPQHVFGADVLNRLNAALRSEARSNELAHLARHAIIDALRDILARDIGEVSPMLKAVERVVIAGNTAMLVLLSESGADQLLQPDYWQQAIACQPSDPVAWHAAWSLPNADIILAPALAGFVGSDLTADIIATGLIQNNAAALLVDIGTNTEFALWDGRQLWVTSVPGGPAFEGVGIRNGMTAESGAIYRVEQDDAGNGLSCSTIGDVPAKGYCGSGLIDMIAILLATGVLKMSGRFAQKSGSEGFEGVPGNLRSMITPGDVDALQRAKAAIATAMEMLLKLSGLSWQAIARLCVCGTFGRHLNIAHAQAIGLLPTIAAERIELHANAALTGCETALLCDEIDVFQKYAALTRVVNLSYVLDYDELYIDHLRLRPIITTVGS